MALGSGSSLATDCWTRRIALPCLAQLLKVGRASRLHQHSSSKPMAHSGLVSAETRLLVILSSKETSAAISQGSRGYSGGQTPLERGVASPSRPQRFSHRKRREFAEDAKIWPPDHPRLWR